jgi:hypothetical protein
VCGFLRAVKPAWAGARPWRGRAGRRRSPPPHLG